jgi:hypothetical protein
MVSTLLLLGICSLNTLLAHSIAVNTSYRSSLVLHTWVYKPLVVLDLVTWRKWEKLTFSFYSLVGSVLIQSHRSEYSHNSVLIDWHVLYILSRTKCAWSFPGFNPILVLRKARGTYRYLQQHANIRLHEWKIPLGIQFWKHLSQRNARRIPGTRKTTKSSWRGEILRCCCCYRHQMLAPLLINICRVFDTGFSCFHKTTCPKLCICLQHGWSNSNNGVGVPGNFCSLLCGCLPGGSPLLLSQTTILRYHDARQGGPSSQDQ